MCSQVPRSTEDSVVNQEAIKMITRNQLPLPESEPVHPTWFWQQ